MPHQFEYSNVYTYEELREEFERRVNWNYPYTDVVVCDLAEYRFFAWIVADYYFEGSYEHSDGKFKRRIVPSEVGM